VAPARRLRRDAPPGDRPGPGWLGLKDAHLYVRYHEAFTEAGYGVLVFDHRGFGDSGGDRGILSRSRQLADLVNAVTYLTTRDDVDADPRLRAAIRQRVLTGHGRLVPPREAIMVPTPERRTTKVKSDVDGLIPTEVSLAAADEILTYRPIDAAGGLTTPLMVVAVEGDATTPTDHAERLCAAALWPEELVMQRHTTHYAAYDRYWTEVTPRMVAWYDAYLRPADVVITRSTEECS
jgi:uncharacterized protein